MAIFGSMETIRVLLAVSTQLFCLSGNRHSAVEASQQYFRVHPKDVQAQEGSEVILQCEIEHLAGRVQWTKDGFALGYNRIIPGYPRYTMVGDSSHGVYNLRIQNVSLADDGEFQCQVGPALSPISHQAIRMSANLTVTSPPSSIELVGHGSNAKIEVKEKQQMTLECLVSRSKPAAKIVWYRENSELKLDNTVHKETESEENSVNSGGRGGKRYDVSSKIVLRPTADDDNVNYTCEAQHEALPRDMPLKASVQLSVLYPPGPPYIEGYTNGETLRRGQNVELICRSRGGNPPAQLVWYKNGEQIRAIYRNYAKTSENVYSFTADMSDNKAKYTCEASSAIGPTQMKTEVNLTVYYAPIHVTISGPTEARINDTINLNCSAGASNPEAQIRWFIDERIVHDRNIPFKTESAPDNGWLTWSTLSIPISQNKTNLVVICHGVNTNLSENVVATHRINIFHPPSQPVITGYKRGANIHFGTLQKLTCISYGGNPLAALTWYKNDKKINTAVRMVDKSFASSEISILINATDNEAVYKCEATNPALDIPLFETIKFNVYFPPDNVIIKKEPKELRAGTVARLICDSSSSNPEAELSWWREGIPVTEGTNKYSKPGLHGGKVSTIDLILSITPDMDGNVYTCQATNTILQRSINSDVTLSVMYKPVFADINETSSIGVEGESLIIPLQAYGHPPSITYTWIKDGKPLARNKNHFIDGPVLNFTKLSRHDTGSYMCEAFNSQGSTTVSFNITVQYSADIAELSDKVLAGEGEDAQLWCVVDAVPLASEHIIWKRPGFPLDKRTTSIFRNNTSYLTIHSVTKDDMGEFYCVAYNGIGNETSQTAYLLVKHKPEIGSSPVIAKSASNIGDTAKLYCRASAAPKPIFLWSRDGAPLPVNSSQKYYVTNRELNEIRYESILFIQNTEVSDYGSYRCTVRNTLGFDTWSVRLSVPTAPDVPFNLSVINTTHDSVTLSWNPGFDGGEEAQYRIRYDSSESNKRNYRYEEVGTNNVYTITGLELGTSYLFSVMAYNKIGSSSYVADAAKATTSSLPAEALLVNAEYPLLLIMCIAATVVFLLLINICILTAFIYRRRKFVSNEGRINERSNTKSGTIEMYAPSSYNETVTGETLSSVSEKSETYSENQQDYEEKRKPCCNTYVIEQIDYPFQYSGYDNHSKENGSIGHHKNPYGTHNGSGYHSAESSCYGSTSDPRYVTYPPPVQFAQPPLPPPPCNRGSVVPPDVTVLSSGTPTTPLSTFNYGNMETEGHLV